MGFPLEQLATRSDSVKSYWLRLAVMTRFVLAIALLPLLLPAAPERARAAEGHVLRLTKADCARVVKYRQAPDTAYRPGVDVHGRPVVPADPDGQTIRLPDKIVIPITVELQDRFGIPANSALFKAEAEIGRIVVDGDRITFNGQLLQDSEILALAEACRRSADHP